MPELPEVETIRQSLLPYVLGKTIDATDVLYPRILKDTTVEQFAIALSGQNILDIRRRGKYLLFLLDSELWMVVHLRMTGRLIFFSNSEVPLEKHTSVIFRFRDKSELRFVDQRKFATIYLRRENDLLSIRGLSSLGPEPLGDNFSLSQFRETLKRSAKVKAVLLDQRRIAGIGNIYADEALFRAGIHPSRSCDTLAVEEIESLFLSIKDVLKEAIDNQGTTIKDYRTGYGSEGNFQNRLAVYGKKGQPCPKCGESIERIRVAGRGSHFCPRCQEERE